MNSGAPTTSLGVLLRELLRLALPLAFVQVGASSLGLIDTAVVGRVSSQELAAVGLGGALVFVFSIFGMGVVLGSEALIAQAVGKGDLARARHWLHHAVLLAVLLSPLLMVAVVAMVALLPRFGIDAAVVPIARVHMLARSVGILPFLVYWALKAYLQSLGNTRAPVVGVVIAVVVELVLDVALVFGVSTLHIPALGALGAGIAHSVTNTARCAVVAVAIIRMRRTDRVPIAFEVAALRRIMALGVPLGLQLALEVGVFALASVVIGRVDAVSLAAHQVAIQCASTTFNAVVGLGSAAAVVVARHIGARSAAALRAGLLACVLSMVFMAVAGVAFLSCGHTIAAWVSNDDDVISQAAQLLMIAAAFQLCDGLQAVASGALRGAGDTRATFIIHLISHWGVGMPTLMVLSARGYGATGVWWGLTLGLTVAALLLVWRFVVVARRGFVPIEASTV